MREKIQGEVELEVVIATDGSVVAAKVIKSLDREFGLDKAAIDCVKQWKFTPGQLDGVAVPISATIVLTFRLH